MTWAFSSARWRARARVTTGYRTEADAGGPAVDADALRPALGGVAARGGPDQEAQSETAAAVAVAAGGLDGPDEGGGEHVGTFHGGFHYSFLYSRLSRWSVPS